jgi:hypothetical protein
MKQEAIILFFHRKDGQINCLEMLCGGIDRKIDEAVYELHGLTEEEIKIVEGKE